jgi:hypothetical protein
MMVERWCSSIVVGSPCKLRHLQPVAGSIGGGALRRQGVPGLQKTCAALTDVRALGDGAMDLEDREAGAALNLGEVLETQVEVAEVELRHGRLPLAADGRCRPYPVTGHDGGRQAVSGARHHRFRGAWPRDGKPSQALKPEASSCRSWIVNFASPDDREALAACRVCSSPDMSLEGPEIDDAKRVDPW